MHLPSPKRNLVLPLAITMILLICLVLILLNPQSRPGASEDQNQERFLEHDDSVPDTVIKVYDIDQMHFGDKASVDSSGWTVNTWPKEIIIDDDDQGEVVQSGDDYQDKDAPIDIDEANDVETRATFSERKKTINNVKQSEVRYVMDGNSDDTDFDQELSGNYAEAGGLPATDSYLNRGESTVSLEVRTRRLQGNARSAAERSKTLLCKGLQKGEMCKILFKHHNDVN